MKLIYLWVNDKDFYDTLSVPLDGRFCFEVKNCQNGLRLSVTKRDCVQLPDNFFSVKCSRRSETRCPRKSKVETVSVVAGRNASGKTSIARYLEAMRSNGDCGNLGFDYVLIYEIESNEKEPTDAEKLNWIVQASFDGKRVDSEIEQDIEESLGIRLVSGKQAREDFAFIYYSPHYTTEDPFFPDDGAMFNLSTTSLMGHRQEADLGVIAFNAEENFVYGNFVAQERRRVLEFSHQCIGLRLEKEFNIRLPKKVRVGCNVKVVHELLSWMESSIAAMQAEVDSAKSKEEKYAAERTLELIAISNDIIAIARNLNSNLTKEKLSSDRHGNFVLNCFCVYLLAYVHTIDFLNNKSDLLRIWHIKRIVVWAKDAVASYIASNCANSFHFYDELLGCLEKNISLNIPKVAGNLAETDDDVTPRKHILELFRWVVGECKKIPEDKQYAIPFIDVESSENSFIEAIGHLSQSHTRVDVFTFSFIPALSSGEMSFVSMLSRLWYGISSLSYSYERGRKEYFIALDEVETTLHPDWQRKIVYWIVRFLELLSEDYRFHVLFMTHSPILLSDVPISNACFLDRREDENGASLQTLKSFDADKYIRLHDTFAANIFDLYHSSFFLREGLVGKFAQDKIDSLLRKLMPKFRSTRYGYHRKVEKAKKRRFKLTNEERLIIDLVGDPFVSSYLRQRAESLGLLDGFDTRDVED